MQCAPSSVQRICRFLAIRWLTTWFTADSARTRAYVERRTKEGMSNKEIHRCLKRYIVRELYPLILADLADSARTT